MDLIAFDSPFVVDPSQGDGITDAQQEVEFESIWNAIEDQQERGWSDASVDHVIRRLQGIDRHRLQVIPADMSPFIGMCWRVKNTLV